MNNQVLVYGTLKQGHGNHHLIRDGGHSFQGFVTLPKEHFAMFSLGRFPSVCKAAEAGVSTPIYGEVYRVDDAVLTRLDALEGHPRWYCRELVDTSCGKAWMYVMPKAMIRKSCPTVESGEWHTRKL